MASFPGCRAACVLVAFLTSLRPSTSLVGNEQPNDALRRLGAQFRLLRWRASQPDAAIGRIRCLAPNPHCGGR